MNILLDKVIDSLPTEEDLKETERQAETSVENMAQLIPNLAALHEDTHFKCFREFKPMRDEFEFTIYYREPGKDKVRIDCSIDAQSFVDGEIDPKKVRVQYWNVNANR